MSNVIRFLEEMGRNPAVGRMAAEGYAATIAAFDIDQPQQEALLARDATVLNNLLEGRAKMFCMVATPDERAPGEAPDQDDGYAPDSDEPAPDRAE